MAKKRKQQKSRQQKAPDRLDVLRNAITDGGKPAKTVLNAFQKLMREDEERDSWAQQEFRGKKGTGKD